MRRFKYVIQLFLAIIFICFIFLINSKYRTIKEESVLTNIEIDISDDNTYNFVSYEDIYKEIEMLMIEMNETRIIDIPLRLLETNLRENPYIRSAEVYSDILGTLYIDVKPFMPYLRFIDSDGLSYFVDDSSNVVPQHNISILDIPIVTQNGDAIPIKHLSQSNRDDIEEKEREKISTQLGVITDFANYLSTDSICTSLFSQISISTIGDIELIPRIGSQYVIFSSLDSLVNYKKSIDKMLRFYKSESAKGVWLDYNVINMKYTGQVVCKK